MYTGISEDGGISGDTCTGISCETLAGISEDDTAGVYGDMVYQRMVLYLGMALLVYLVICTLVYQRMVVCRVTYERLYGACKSRQLPMRPELIERHVL